MMDFLNIVLVFAPLVLLLYFANQAQRLREGGQPAGALVAVCYIVLVLLYATILLIGLAFLALGGLSLPAAPVIEAGAGVCPALLPVRPCG